MVREGRVLISVATDPDFGSNYLVTAYEVGAQVAQSASGTSTILVRAGHGFAAGDKFIVNLSLTQFVTVNSVDATHLYVASSTVVTAGDILVNLGPDTGGIAPNYDGSGVSVYSDMAYSILITPGYIQCDSTGRYRYYHTGVSRWELVRSNSTTPFALYQDTDTQGVGTPTSTTDNAVARWDGTDGHTIQSSSVLISDAGAVTGVTTLSASSTITAAGTLIATAAATVGTTLSVGGTSTLAAVNASGTVAAAAAATVGTTLTVGTSLAVGTTLAVTGTGTFGGYVMRTVSSNVTASTTHTSAAGTALTSDFNRIGVCANNGDAVTLPSAVAGMSVVVHNDVATAHTLGIYPQAADDLGNGAGVVRTTLLAAGSSARFFAIDDTYWREF